MDLATGRRDAAPSVVGVILYSGAGSPDFNSVVLGPVGLSHYAPRFLEVSYILSQAEPPVLYGPVESLVAMDLSEADVEAATARRREREREAWHYVRG